jgi:hypothetical protein
VLHSAGALLLISAAISSLPGAEEPPRRLELVADPHFSIEPGVLTTASLLHLVMGYGQLLPNFGVDENQASGHILATGGRTIAFVFIDFPLTMFAHLLNHEVFGHGARAREQGFKPTYLFTLPPPYSWLLDSGPQFHGGTSIIPTPTSDRALPFSFGGFEAQSYASYTINRRIAAAGGRLEYSDLLLYFGKLVYYESFVDLSSATQYNSDAGAYVEELRQRFNLWRDTDRTSLTHQLTRAWAAGVFIDPTLWAAVYDLFIGRLLFGLRSFTIKFIELGDVSIYPATRFNLSPFGAEHYLDLFIHMPAATFAPYFRFSSSGLATDLGGGASIFGWPVLSDPELRLGADLDFWVQPQILLDEKNVFTRPTLLGGNVAARADLTLFGDVGLILKLAYKTRGYLMGQPIDPGLYGFAGFRLGL